VGIDRSDIARPYAFLFDGSIDGLPNPQLPFFTAAVLTALSQADPQGRTLAQVRVGVPSLTRFAERTTAVRGTESSSGRTISHDTDSYKYVVWDWLDSLDQGWSSVDRELGQEIFRLHSGECIAFSALGDDIRNSVDSALQSAPGYVGGFAIDPGNPVHHGAFFDLLTYPAAIVNGAVVHERSFEGDKERQLDGATQFRPRGLVWKNSGWIASKGPRGLSRAGLSERGAKAAANVAQKRAPSVETRVIEAIDRAFFMNTDRKSFEFESVGGSSDVLQGIMPEGKFTKFLFDREHKEGGSKAAFFIDELGFDPEDWRYLAAQFYNGLLMAQVEAVEFKSWDRGYNVRFNVQMRVRGRSGNKAVVVTGWNKNPGELPSLSTAYPGDRNAEAVEPGEPTILLPGRRTDAAWKQLWDWANAAGVRAGETVVPTPMYIVGFEPVSEGECGNAAVRVPNAGTGLARWLVRHGPGKTDGCGGAVVFSPLATQSLDRATAWARAVRSILYLNDVVAKVETYLD
jgi:hypothetical protein